MEKGDLLECGCIHRVWKCKKHEGITITDEEYTMKEPTQIQIDTYCFIEQYIILNGYPPTYRDIADEFCIVVRAAYDRVTSMESKGMLSITPKISRGIKLKDYRKTVDGEQ